ncbi:MAG: hypothetical protein ACPLPX_09815 [Candidatus Kapaibacteriota bacterium]
MMLIEGIETWLIYRNFSLTTSFQISHNIFSIKEVPPLAEFEKANLVEKVC